MRRSGERDHRGGGRVEAGAADLDTTGILFVCSGSFDGLNEIVTARRPAAGTPIEVTRLDLEIFGLLPAFADRLTTVALLDPLTAAELERLLRDPERSLLAEHRRLFELNGVHLDVTDTALSAIAAQALAEGAGVRGVQRVVERVLTDALFAIAGGSDAVRCVVTEGAIRGEAAPKLIDKDGTTVNPVNGTGGATNA